MKNPFLHQNLEIKNELVAHARNLMQKEGEDIDTMAAKLAAGLLYANLADYLAANLLQGLEEMNKVATREYLNGSIVYRSRSSLNMPLEKTVHGLKKYDFPSRDTILKLLDDVRISRNKLAHEIFKTPDLADIGAATAKLRDSTEDLLSEINAIYRNMPPKTILETGDSNDKA